MKKRRLLLITRIRSVVSAAVLGIFLVLSGGALALADGIVDLKAQTIDGMQNEDTVHGVATTGDNCPVCPHSHQSDTNHSCCCSHFQISPVQTFLLHYVPRSAMQEFSESVSILADVYFERFIPPQNQA